MKSKKAMTMNVIVSIIITLVSFMLISLVVVKFTGNIEEDETLCHNSVGIRASTAINIKTTFGDTELKSPLTCKTIDLKFSDEREKVKKAIADKMARCWWMFYEGRYEQILDGTSAQVTFFGTDDLDNSCFLCYSIITDDIEKGTISTEEMYDYFRNTPYTKVKNLTYLEYFQRGGGPGIAGLLTNIEPYHSYGISFLAKNTAVKSTPVEGAAKSIIGAGVVVVSVATFNVYGVVLGAGLTSTGINNLQATLYDKAERDVSMVFLDDLNNAQSQCFKGDLGGS